MGRTEHQGIGHQALLRPLPPMGTSYLCVCHAHPAQFVIISLRNNMFELADRLVGIYKTDNTTKTVTINPGQFVLPSAAAGGPAGTAAAAAGAAEDGEKENQGAARAAQGKHGAGKGAEVGASPAAGQRLVSVA